MGVGCEGWGGGVRRGDQEGTRLRTVSSMGGKGATSLEGFLWGGEENLFACFHRIYQWIAIDQNLLPFLKRERT